MIEFILKKPHRKNCTLWKDPWFLDTNNRFWGDTLGRSNGSSKRWIPVECNSTDCNARGVVSVESIEQAIYEQEKRKK